MKKTGLHIDKTTLALHTIFWMIWVVVFTLIQSIGGNGHVYFTWLMYYLITLPLFIAHTYLVAYWLLPVTFFRRKYFLAGAGLFVLLVLFSILELIISNELVFRNFNPHFMQEPGYLNPLNIIVSGIGNHYIILVFLAIKAGLTWYNSSSQTKTLQLAKTETELEIYRYQLQPKLILTLMEELETVGKNTPDKMGGLIVKISGFLNDFLFEVKDELIPLGLEIKLTEQFLAVHKQALGRRLKGQVSFSGNVQAHVCPPLLLLPFINSMLKIVYECNNLFESTVILKAEKKYLLMSFTFWSENDFAMPESGIMEMTKKRLQYNYPSKYRIIENIEDNFAEISIEIFY